jgi:hypothetical protein
LYEEGRDWSSSRDWESIPNYGSTPSTSGRSQCSPQSASSCKNSSKNYIDHLDDVRAEALLKTISDSGNTASSKTRLCFDILGLPDNADKSAVSKAYKTLAIIYHPDKRNESGDTKSKLINAAHTLCKEALSEDVRSLPDLDTDTSNSDDLY